MALGNRQLLTPEWAFHHRDSVAGAMLARVVLTSLSGNGNSTWTPDAGFADQPTDSEVPVYQGIARIQPNKDWRARKQKFETEQVVEHAYRIQLAFDGNELEGMPFPERIDKGDRVRVISVPTLRGVPIDPSITNYTYVVRNAVTGSNYWVRTLLCDVIIDG